MEQENSLKAELENLSRIQEEQVDILRQMRTDDQIHENLDASKSQDIQFNSPAMYANTSNYLGYQQVPQFTPQYISPYAQSMNDKFATSVDSLTKSNSGQYGFLGVVSPSSSASMMSRTLMNMDYSSRVSQAVTTGIGAIGSTATSFGIGSMLPGLAGLGIGIGGGAILGAYTDKANEEIQKNSSLKKYIYRNSGKFIDSFESNNNRGVTGFSREESADAANFTRTMNDEFYMDDDDTMMLLQKFTEGGLLKESKDLDSFKEKMLTLTKSVKESALILNETYDSIADLMSEMRKAGIDQKDFKSNSSLSNVIGGLLGEDGGDVMRHSLDFIQNLNSGTSFDNNNSLSRLQNTTTYVAQYYNELFDKFSTSKGSMTAKEKSNKNMIDNLGGSEKASEYIMATMEKMTDNESIMRSGLMYFDWDKRQKDFTFNRDKYKKYISTSHTQQEIADNASGVMTNLIQSGQGDAWKKWNSSFETYIKNSMNDGELTDMIHRTVKNYVQDPQLQKQGFDERTIMSQYFGVSDSGTQNLLSGFFDYKGNNPNLMRDVKLQSMWQNTTASMFAKAPSASEWAKSKWEGFTDKTTQWAVNADNTIGEWIQKISDKISGVDKINPRYDKVLKTESNLKSISYDDVVQSIKDNNKIIASTQSALNNLKDKGYTVNDDLSKYVKDKFDNLDKVVSYDRDVISDWGNISQGLKESKNEIVDTAKKNDLSEVIVAALYKYNQSKPSGEKIDISNTTKKLGEQVFEYGGNYNAALAVTLGGAKQSEVDSAFKSAGYNMKQLREVGGQTAIKDIDIGKLNLTDEVKEKVNEILSQQLTGAIEVGFGDAVSNAFSLGGNSSAESINSILTGSLTGKGQTYVDLGRKYGVDPGLVAAISMQETGGNSSALVNNNNPGGIMDPNSNWSKVKQFGSFEQGLEYVFKNLKDNYISQGYDTIEKIHTKYSPEGAANDPNGLNAEWTSGVSKFYKKTTENVSEDQNWTNEGAGSNKTYSGVITTSERVNKNQDGTISEKTSFANDVFKSGKGIYEVEMADNAYKRMSAFNLTNPNNLISRTSENRLDEITNSLKQLAQDNKISPRGVNGLNSLSYETRSTNSYMEKLSSLISKGEYSSLEGALNDKGIQEQRQKVIENFKDKDAGEKFLKDLEAKEFLNADNIKKGNNDVDSAKFSMLEQFGRARGIRKEDYMSDIGQYSLILNKQATHEYGDIKKMMKDYINNENTDEAKKWSGLSAAEKESFMNLGKELSYATNDEDEWNVSSLIEKKGKESYHNKEDNDKLKHLKKNKFKEWEYDENYDARTDLNASNNTWDDFDQWRNQGEKINTFSSLKSEFEKNGLGDFDSGKTIDSMKDTINTQIDSILKEVNKKTTEALTESKKVLDGSTGNSQIDSLSGDKRKELSEAIQQSDTDKIGSLQEELGLNDDVLAGYKKLAEALNGMDISSLNGLVTALDEIQKRASDISKLTTTLAGDMGSGFEGTLKSNIQSVMSGAFDENSDIYKLFNHDNNFDYNELAKALNTGESKDGTKLSPESIDDLSTAMSKAVQESMETELSSEDGRGKFQSSATYQEMEGDKKEKLDTLLTDIGKVADKIAEAQKSGSYTEKGEDGESQKIEVDAQGIEDLKEQQNQLIEETTKLYQESLKDLTDSQKDEIKNLDTASEAAKKASETADAFKSAMDSYEGAMSTAINNLNSKVSQLDSKVSSMPTGYRPYVPGNTVGRS